MDTLKFADLLFELVEEMKIARITVTENEGRIQQLVEECHDKERKLEEEVLKTQSLKDKHEETKIILSKASDDKITHLEAEKNKLLLAVDSWEKEMKAMKEEVRTLQLSKYNLERTVREQQHRLQTQGQTKTSYSEQVADIENRCKHLQKEMASYSEMLNNLKKEVTEAGVLNRKLASTNSHQKCQISSMKDELERKQQDMIKLRVHVTEKPDNANDKEMTELKIEQLNKELKQIAQINQDLKTQLEETRLAHQVTQTQLQRSQGLTERCMASTKALTERTAQQEAQVAALTKECALLSEQRTKANTEVIGQRQEMDEWDARKKTEILALEEERDKAKNECNNLKKAALNLEDINVSWASKNQAMTKDMQNLKMQLDSQSAELDKLNSPTCKFDKDTQTLSSTNDDLRFAGISRTDREECVPNLAGEKSTAESIKDEDTQTVGSEARDLYVEVLNQLVEEGNTLGQENDTVNAPPSDTYGAISEEAKIDTHKDETAQGKMATMKGQKTEETSSEKSKQNTVTPIKDMPVRAMVLEQIPKCKGDGDNKQRVSTGEDNCHHQLQSITDTNHLHVSGNLSDELCLNTEKETQKKETQMKGSAMGQDPHKFCSTITETTSKFVSSNRSSGSLEVPAKVSCTAISEAYMGNIQLPAEVSNNGEMILSLGKEASLPPKKQDVETSSNIRSYQPDVSVSTAEEAISHAVLGNQDQDEIYDEDIVIPSTYVEENSSHRRREECGEKQECDTIISDHDASEAYLEAKGDGSPVTTETRRRGMQLSVSPSSQVGLKSNCTESTNTLPVLLLAAENRSGDGESAPTTEAKSMDIALKSENLSTSKDLGDTHLKKSTPEKTVLADTDDIEIMIQGKDGYQNIRSSQSRSQRASTDKDERHLPATNLCGLGASNSLMRKEKFSSATTESKFLHTPKRKHTPSSHQVPSSYFVPKPATLAPDMMTFSTLSNSEPLSAVSNEDALQKHSLAKTMLTWSSSPTKTTEPGSATHYPSWKILDKLRMQPQQQQSNQRIRTPMMFSHLPLSAQQLHHITYSSASAVITNIHPTSASLSSIAQQSTETPRTFGLSQASIPKTSMTQAEEIRGFMPRLTHGRSIMDRSSERAGQQKVSSNEQMVTQSTPVSPKHPPGPINLQCWPPTGVDQDHGGAGDAGGEVSLFSDDEGDEDIKDGVASQIDRIQTFLQKDRLKRAKLE